MLFRSVRLVDVRHVQGFACAALGVKRFGRPTQQGGQPVNARIAIRRTGTPKVIALDHDGKPTEAVVPVENGAFTIDGARDKTPYYLLEF